MTNVAETLKFVLGRVENSLGKGENAGYQHVLVTYFVICKCIHFGLL